MVLGMREQVVIAEYDPEWPRSFDAERDAISMALGKEALAIEHVGSTAVPGLAAKPIIDILLVPDQFPMSVPTIDSLCALDYYYKGPGGIEGRQYFTKSKWLGTHHIHAFGRDNPEVARHLLFRDYLRAYPAEATRYAELKRSLASSLGTRRAEYTDGKTPMIREMDAQAILWWRSRGSPLLHGLLDRLARR